MNNLKDIYTNIFTNIENYYTNYLNDKIIIPFIPSVDFKSEQWKNYRQSVINCLSNGKCDNNIVQQIGYMHYIDGIKYQNKTYNYIPVFIAFTVENKSILNFAKPPNNRVKYRNEEFEPAPLSISFFINIITHIIPKTNSITLSAGINDIFYRELTYMEMSVDIFNHIYQPHFQLINTKDKINDILNKYNIELPCMGSMFSNDPVNKRLFGLPKINTADIVKEYPDVYRVFQDQGVNYRKVINSGTHNPFTK
ncbi:MAG: hypothetical protein IJ997_01065 [Mycoplasmataceae bacterium]|nr:hypothetical protein [Mycoplasmataceae bacterium]